MRSYQISCESLFYLMVVRQGCEGRRRGLELGLCKCIISEVSWVLGECDFTDKIDLCSVEGVEERTDESVLR